MYEQNDSVTSFICYLVAVVLLQWADVGGPAEADEDEAVGAEAGAGRPRIWNIGVVEGGHQAVRRSDWTQARFAGTYRHWI